MPCRDCNGTGSCRANGISKKITHLGGPARGEHSLCHLHQSTEHDSGDRGQEETAPERGKTRVPIESEDGEEAISHGVLKFVPTENTSLGNRGGGDQRQPENNTSPDDEG